MNGMETVTVGFSIDSEGADAFRAFVAAVCSFVVGTFSTGSVSAVSAALSDFDSSAQGLHKPQ